MTRPVPARPGRVAIARRLWRRLGSTLCIATALAVATSVAPEKASAAPDRIEARQATVESREDGYYCNADFDFELKPRIADALEHGLTLYFVVESEFTHSRWYWFDEKAVNAVLVYRVTYHALTRQYRLSTGNLQLGFPTLQEALGVMTHVRDWKVADRGALQTGLVYSVAVRMRLDTTQLPKPFQITMLTNREWTLESDWKRFPFEPR